MMDTIEILRQTARKLLERNDVDMVIGYGEGSDPLVTQPMFITSPDEVDKLIWSPLCVAGLTKYLSDLKNRPGKIGIVVKGCDSRGINRLTQDNIIPRSKAVVVGIPCAGQISAEKLAAKIDQPIQSIECKDKGTQYEIITNKGKYTIDKAEIQFDKCAHCEHHNPVVHDFFIGEPLDIISPPDDYEDIKKLEAMSPAEKTAFWQAHFSRCIRCNACKNVCPGCTCRECIFDAVKPEWTGKEVNLAENEMFHLTRAMHLAGRCIDCGECDRVCPAKIPLRLLNRKILMDCKDLFEIETPGSTEEGGSTLGEYKLNDPEEFL